MVSIRAFVNIVYYDIRFVAEISKIYVWGFRSFVTTARSATYAIYICVHIPFCLMRAAGHWGLVQASVKRKRLQRLFLCANVNVDDDFNDFIIWATLICGDQTYVRTDGPSRSSVAKVSEN